ncbi:hypothetical protein [Brevundimonas sp. NIBR11]|uniref:hypothetical protein n=1 Tax=Brevundimonas sp. NIBR11 TaxID=3015999 RepID=UPI0022EFF8CF|nr:hypothetical protein [Brevundimonas sp. NIBR11]WGM29926.1 hypothetical protein KKHFBJBL_00140 [Brevundimonas sp. NIBR11]
MPLCFRHVLRHKVSDMAHPFNRTDVRFGLAVVAAVGVLGAGAFAFGGSRTSHALGDTLSIALVPPVEPTVDPGSTMEVGMLNDGFDRAVLERVPETRMDDTLPPPAWIGDESLGDPTPRMPMPTPVSDTRVVEVTRSTPPRDPLGDGSRSFGFDGPRRDYAAERAERWKQLQAEEARSAAVAPVNDVSSTVQYSSE